MKKDVVQKPSSALREKKNVWFIYKAKNKF
jgi:hypothetical protein